MSNIKTGGAEVHEELQKARIELTESYRDIKELESKINGFKTLTAELKRRLNESRAINGKMKQSNDMLRKQYKAAEQLVESSIKRTKAISESKMQLASQHNAAKKIIEASVKMQHDSNKRALRSIIEEFVGKFPSNAQNNIRAIMANCQTVAAVRATAKHLSESLKATRTDRTLPTPSRRPVRNENIERRPARRPSFKSNERSLSESARKHGISRKPLELATRRPVERRLNENKLRGDRMSENRLSEQRSAEGLVNFEGVMLNPIKASMLNVLKERGE